MHSSEKNVSSYYDTNTNATGINKSHNRKNFLSFINTNNLNQNKYKLLNIIDKKESINSTNLNNINKKKNPNSILNKLLINQVKRENILSNKANQDTSFNSDKIPNNNIVDNIFLSQIMNKSKNDNNFNKSYNPNNYNENTYNYQTNNNEKAQKINFALESHQLINSLLKNQNKNSKKKYSKNKVINNPSEISFSSSFDNNTKKIFDISPSKDSIELSCNNNQNDSFSKNLYLQYWNQNKEPIQINNNNKDNLNNISYDNNIFFGLNKDNNDIKKQKNQHFNSPNFNFYNNHTNNINYRNKKYSNSPLRMADVFMLKKHHSINPYNKTDKNNYIESITFSNKNLKKIIFIKPSSSKSKNDEEKNEDEIKVIRQKDKKNILLEKKDEKIEKKEEKKFNGIKYLKDIIKQNNLKEIKNKENKNINKNNELNYIFENKENKEINDNNDNKENNDNNDNNDDNNDNNENKENNNNNNLYKKLKDLKELKEFNEFRRNNDIIRLPKRKFISKTKKELNNENQINIPSNVDVEGKNINNKIKEIQEIKKRIDIAIKNNNENEVRNKIVNNDDKKNINKKENVKLSIQIDKISNDDGIKIMRNLSPTINFNENTFLNNKKNEVESPKINSIRRRFMNSKNKYNNFTPDIEIRNKNEQLNKDDKINAYIDNYNNNNNINIEKYKGVKSFEKIKKEEPFKINLSRINNKENEEIKLNNTNININIEKEIINKNFLNTEKEIRRAYYSPKERINISPFNDKKK